MQEMSGNGCFFPFFSSITGTRKVSAEKIQVIHLKKGKSRVSDRVTKREH